MFNDVIKEKSIEDRIRDSIFEEIERSMSDIRKQNIDYNADLEQLLTGKVDDIVNDYLNYFTNEELKDMLDFRETELGKKIESFKYEVLNKWTSEIVVEIMELVLEKEFDELELDQEERHRLKDALAKEHKEYQAKIHDDIWDSGQNNLSGDI